MARCSSAVLWAHGDGSPACLQLYTGICTLLWHLGMDAREAPPRGQREWEEGTSPVMRLKEAFVRLRVPGCMGTMSGRHTGPRVGGGVVHRPLLLPVMDTGR